MATSGEKMATTGEFRSPLTLARHFAAAPTNGELSASSPNTVAGPANGFWNSVVRLAVPTFDRDTTRQVPAGAPSRECWPTVVRTRAHGPTSRPARRGARGDAAAARPGA